MPKSVKFCALLPNSTAYILFPNKKMKCNLLLLICGMCTLQFSCNNAKILFKLYDVHKKVQNVSTVFQVKALER